MQARSRSLPQRRLARVLGGLALSLLLVILAACPTLAGASPTHSFLFAISEFKIAEPPPSRTELFEDLCGVAVDSSGNIYTSDYYRDRVVVLGPTGAYMTMIRGLDPDDGPCGLALDPSGRLYVNDFHRSVLSFDSLGSSPAPIDSNHPTGIAVDPASGDLYVDDRAYIAHYAAPITPGEQPVQKIGLGSLGSGYGVAVSDFPATDGYVYVADSSDRTVKVYDPATDLSSPVAVIDGQGTPQRGFSSLTDSALAIDQSDGHLFVTDNLQSRYFEHPEAALDEFNAAGDYRGQLPRFPTFVDGGPPGLAIADSSTPSPGNLYLTSGNSEEASINVYGPTVSGYSLQVSRSGAGTGSLQSQPAGIDCGSACTAEFNQGEEVTVTAIPDPDSAFLGWSGGGCSGAGSCTVTMSQAQSLSAEFGPAPPVAGGAAPPGHVEPASSAAAVEQAAAPALPGVLGQSVSARVGASPPLPPHPRSHRHRRLKHLKREGGH